MKMMNEKQLDKKYKKLLKSLSNDEIVSWYNKFLGTKITNELFGYFSEYSPEGKEKTLKKLSKITRENIENRYEVNDDGTGSGFVVWDNLFNEEAGWCVDEEEADELMAELIQNDLKEAGLE
jgi:hypothetical protein